MCHNTLENYYTTSYALTAKRRVFSLTELENMIPFERDVYMKLIRDDDEIEAERARQEAAIQEARSRARF